MILWIKKKLGWFLICFFGIVIGLYPLIYLFVDRKTGLLGMKDDILLHNVLWNIGFYTHISFGGLALLIGWVQFNKRIRKRNINIHRKIGKLYIIAVVFSSLTAVYVGFYATGGVVAATGFIILGVLWFFFSIKGYTSAKQKDFYLHEKMMIYSYACCFAAVTLRLWMPILISYFGGFEKAYVIVAWLSWIPNLLVAFAIVRKKSINAY